MAQKPETKIVDAIQAWVEEHDGNVLKLNGNAFQRKGEPDLLGGVPVSYGWQTWLIHFAVEAKLPGEEPPPLQVYRLKQWDKVGFYTGVVTSLDEFIALVTKAAEVEWFCYA